MRVAISYPPILNRHGQLAMVPQNRNVQFFEKPNFLLGIVQAQAASWLKQLGHEVLWDDGSAQLKTYEQWWSDLVRWKPDMIVFESTTPVMKFYWRQIDKLKDALPECILVMTGYQSMRKPDETMTQSRCDVIISSNHIDFVLRRFVDYIVHDRNWRETCTLEG
jgi:anaerobic magnesium-protoporphyrin IX monomethyl ester cyclase